MLARIAAGVASTSAHGQEVLSELGYPADKIAELRQAKVVA